MKDHEIREFVNELTETAVSHEGCQSLREALSTVVRKYITEDNQYPKDAQGRCIECRGWGCPVCCGSYAEIRARQGIFS